MVSGKKPDMSNGTTKHRDQAANMSFNKKDIAGGNKGQNGNASSFRTDSAISGGRKQGEGRALQPWKPDGPEDTDGSLESGHSRNAGGKQWDQFAENERLFNIKTDYRDEIYTTTIDKSHPQYQQRLAAAYKMERDILSNATTNSHVAEERITDNLATGDKGDEEDKYSGVRRQKDFPPLSSSNANKYTPPARRAPTGQSTVSGAPVDPAIISSQLAKPANEKSKTSTTPKSTKPEVATPPTTTESSFAATPEQTAATSVTPAPASRTASPQVQATPNATATVERDVHHAFKNFAARERTAVINNRSQKAKNDKEIKLNDLKKFADSFKLNTPVPSDLVSIIAKDPAKQKEIQEKAKRNAEEANKVSTSTPESVKTAVPTPDTKPAQRPAPATHGTSPSAVPSRQNTNSRNQNFYNPQQSFRNDRPQGQQAIVSQQSRQQPSNLGARLKQYDQGKQTNPVPSFNHDARQPPTGPSSQVEPNFSRCSSGVTSVQGTRSFNVTAKEFQPNAAAPAFSPSIQPSTTSSPKSVAVETAPQISRSLLRRKPISSSDRPDITKVFNTIDFITSFKAPAGKEAVWNANGGLRPAYDTPPVWRSQADTEPEDSTMLLTYSKLFEQSPFPLQAMSSPNPSHIAPQIPHQYQLPFHMQGAQNMPPRGSPRQPPMNMHGNQHLHGQNPSFNGSDDLTSHRMMPSLSSQSYVASPRLQNAPLAAGYPSPMNQSAQLAYNPQMMPYQGAPPMQHQYRSLSQNHQYVAQQSHLGPMMMQNPSNGFGGPQGMAPGPQMMYPQGSQGQYMQPGNGPPAMPGTNGHPSPGRSAPMMMNQGSQQGHQQAMFGMAQGMSPGPQYGNMAPMYAQQQFPGQQMPMRGYPGQNQFGTSPQQMHQFQPQQPYRNNNHSNGNHNNNGKNFQHQGQHSSGPPNQVPTGPQARPTEAGEESK